jgi:hypothetical protein
MAEVNDDWTADATQSEGFDPNQGFDDIDTSGVDGSEVGSGERDVDKVGSYHFAIQAIPKPGRYKVINGQEDYTKPVAPHILCLCRVLESVPGQSPKGAVYVHRLPMAGVGGEPMKEAAKESMLNFLVGLGVLQTLNGVVIDPRTGTTKLQVSTFVERINAVKQIIGVLKLRKSNDPQYADRIELVYGRGAFRVDSPSVRDVPKNAAALAEIGMSHVQQSAAAPGHVNPPVKPERVAKPAPTPPAPNKLAALD